MGVPANPRDFPAVSSTSVSPQATCHLVLYHYKYLSGEGCIFKTICQKKVYHPQLPVH
jgi:hypothetical protein